MADDHGDSVLGGWDPDVTRQFVTTLAPIARRWFRAEVRGLGSFPRTGGALLVSNHSGGTLTPDVLIMASAFYSEFGYDRPLYTLGHDALFAGPLGAWQRRIGLIPASTANAVHALQSGGVVLVFPGGIYDAFRPTLSANTVDFNGRTGYVRTAIEAGVPIVPSVSIGGQQSQLFLTRGSWLAKHLGLSRFRAEVLPITLGFPFGLSMIVPPNLPLPTRIVAQMAEAIDIAAQFGSSPDINDVDTHVRSVMQATLDDLARERRFPILG
jgi:1-acyl-sn-glycerol-3-phosphate acyltransferase